MTTQVKLIAPSGEVHFFDSVAHAAAALTMFPSEIIEHATAEAPLPDGRRVELFNPNYDSRQCTRKEAGLIERRARPPSDEWS